MSRSVLGALLKGVPFVLAFAIVAGFAFASIPDSQGVIHGCYAPALANRLRVIDTGAGQKCRATEKQLNWNRTGPQGSPGPQGPPGSPAPVPPVVCPECRFDGAFHVLGYTLANAYLPRAVMNNVDAPGVDARGADFQGTVIEGTNGGPPGPADWHAADLSGANLIGAVLATVNFAGANFSDVKARSAALQNDNLTNSDFTGADLTGAYLFQSDLTGANLTGVIWSSTTCPDGTNSNDNGGTCLGHLK
jgi:hypothetical protein